MKHEARNIKYCISLEFAQPKFIVFSQYNASYKGNRGPSALGRSNINMTHAEEQIYIFLIFNIFIYAFEKYRESIID